MSNHRRFQIVTKPPEVPNSGDGIVPSTPVSLSQSSWWSSSSEHGDMNYFLSQIVVLKEVQKSVEKLQADQAALSKMVNSMMNDFRKIDKKVSTSANGSPNNSYETVPFQVLKECIKQMASEHSSNSLEGLLTKFAPNIRSDCRYTFDCFLLFVFECGY